MKYIKIIKIFFIIILLIATFLFSFVFMYEDSHVKPKRNDSIYKILNIKEAKEFVI